MTIFLNLPTSPKNLQFDWQDTQLGIKVEGEPSFTYVDLKGSQGLQGIPGVKGDTGAVGATGLRGIQGLQGATGATGAIGAMPSHQWSGTTLRFQTSATTWGNYVDLKGATGATGAQGTQGIQGIQGATGSTGLTGATGAMGAMPNHQWSGTTLRFQTSSTTWGSYTDLKGDTGATGAQGSTGATGPAGTTLWSGLTGTTALIPGAGASSHTHGSISISGSKNSYAGIAFSDANAVFMVRNTDQLSGVYHNNGTWKWYFDGNGVLQAGTVLWANIANVPATFTPSSHTHTNFAHDIGADSLMLNADPLNKFEINRLTIRGSSPTIVLRDVNQNSAMLHCNSNLFYILRGGIDTSTWTSVNGRWPLTIDLTNNDAAFGGNVDLPAGKLDITSLSNQVYITTTDSTANNKKWSFNVFNGDGDLYFQTFNDAGTFLLNALRIRRNGDIHTAGAVAASGAISASNISQTNIASTIVQRDSAGDIKCRLIRGEYIPTSGGNFQHIVVQRIPGVDTDNYFRTATLAEFRASVTDGVYLPIGGQAANAALFDGLDSAAFIRSDVTDTVNATTIWADNQQIRLGSGSDHRMYFDGSNTLKDNYVGSIFYRNFAHGGYHYFQGENSEGVNWALAYFGDGLSRLFGAGTENLRCDATETISYKNFKISNGGPLLKLEDTDATQHSFWLHANGSVFYVLTDRDNNGNWEVPHPFYLNNVDSTGVLYGKKIANSSNLTIEDNVNDSNLLNEKSSGNIYIRAKVSTGVQYTCATFSAASQYLNHLGASKLVTTGSGVIVYGAVATSSDPKLKENVKSLTNSLQDVEQIEYTTFDWIENKLPGLGIKLSTLPEHLKPPLMGEALNPETEEMTLNFNYSSFVAVVGQAVKELSQKVKQLESRILELEKP